MTDHTFSTKAEAIAAGYRVVNHRKDRDISDPNCFGYDFQNGAGEKTVTVWLTDETNKAKRKGAFVAMYPPKS